ncbi:hypothetical protein Syun_000204 [Stephania yunnanensis]|uniref:BUB1 N-terminal domain-containing protein n=1 Tax=Stephania yunnanensis TaxID=152371 RepID=A0AAP0LH33_9MAGN
MADETHTHDVLFSSLISDIKTYTGKDPLLPWLRGIRKIMDSLPPPLLREKLPRFLQKCAQSFQSDRRYRNDLRYVRVWIQLLDFVDDPKPVLRAMEANRIGKKQALFYQAYSLYYEKLKRFEEAEKMYHLGVQNFAEPAVELQKSYEQFLHRVEQHKKRKSRRLEGRAAMTSRRNFSGDKIAGEMSKDAGHLKEPDTSLPERHGHPKFEIFSSNTRGKSSEVVSKPSGNKDVTGAPTLSSSLKQADNIAAESSRMFNEETVFVKFVDKAIDGRSEAEDACHHGLVDPTVNLKEAMNAINNMFREPLELEPINRQKSQKSSAKVDKRVSTGLEEFVDESFDNGRHSSGHNKENGGARTDSRFVHPSKLVSVKKHKTETATEVQEGFKIFVDDENGSDFDDGNDENVSPNIQYPSELSSQHVGSFVFPIPNDLQSTGSDVSKSRSSPNLKLREETVVGRFVGSAILDDPVVENACHHGLVEPTINMKEAMDAINNMFGKPIDFVRMGRPKKQSKSIDRKKVTGGFSILADEDVETQQLSILADEDDKTRKYPKSSFHLTNRMGSGCDFNEPTVFTREAMDDINEMFGRPLDF